MKEPRQCEQTLDFSQSLTNPSLSVAGSFVAGLETFSAGSTLIAFVMPNRNLD